MDSQKTTSKTSTLNLMLLRAWRERWTDSQWGINIKSVLPRGVSGDVYNLADCILQQAVVGSDANRLVLSYLRHSLCSHLISHASVLKRISKYDGFDKTYCLIALLEFLESIISGVTCRGKPEESGLGNAMLSLSYWLSEIYSTALELYRLNSGLNYEQTEMIERCTNVMDKIVNHQFLMGVIYVGKHEDPELFDKLKKLYLSIKNDVANIGGGYLIIKSTTQTTKPFDDLLETIAHIDMSQLDVSINSEASSVEPITYCLQPILAVKVLQNPNSDTQAYVTDLLMIQSLKNYSMSRLYCEIIRACLMSLYVSGTSRESIWCAFTFIKVPYIIKQLSAMAKDFDDTNKLDYCPDVIAAFEMLAEDPILDFMDTKCACNTIKYLLTELSKQHLVNQKHIDHFLTKRDVITTALSKLDLSNQQQPPIIRFVICAETPFSGILKALGADYNKMQEPLLGMFCQVLSGNSLELILSVASVEGKLKTFVSRLINCNESSKQITGETGKLATIRASLFDVSFLMLTCIVQTYGSDIVLEERGNSFFEKWVRECMIERNKYKSPMNMIHQCDQSKVDELLMHLNSTDNSLKTSSLKWQDICLNIPGMLYNVLLAWENNTISPADVKTNLDSIRSPLCAYSVCAASWLSSYMQIVRDDELLKPRNMIQQFLTPTPAQQTELSQQENFEERMMLTTQIIRKMQQDVYPNKKINNLPTQNLVSTVPLEDQFVDVWKVIIERGWVPIDAVQTLDSLLQSCGPLWLITKLINEIMLCKYKKDMLKTMDIVFSLMHLDIERCTVALLNEWLPMLLLNKLQKSEMSEPQSIVLARLCVMCILATMEVPGGGNANLINPKKRRTRPSETLDDLDTGNGNNNGSGGGGGVVGGNSNGGSVQPPLKTRKLNSSDGENTSSNDFVFDMAAISGRGGTGNDQTIVMNEALQICLQQLFKTFSQFVLVDELSPKIYFIFRFLSLLVQCGKDRVRPVLKLLPNGLVQNLLKIIVIDEFTIGFILNIYDLNTTSGRQSSMSDLCLLRNIQLRTDSINL